MNWTDILVSLIAAGLLKYAADLAKWFVQRRHEGTPQGRQTASIATVDQSLAVVARARDELEADNARLRAQMAETDARHESDRAQWLDEKIRMKAEIADLERRLREMLTEVENLKLRHA